MSDKRRTSMHSFTIADAEVNERRLAEKYANLRRRPCGFAGVLLQFSNEPNCKVLGHVWVARGSIAGSGDVSCCGIFNPAQATSSGTRRVSWPIHSKTSTSAGGGTMWCGRAENVSTRLARNGHRGRDSSAGDQSLTAPQHVLPPICRRSQVSHGKVKVHLGSMRDNFRGAAELLSAATGRGFGRAGLCFSASGNCGVLDRAAMEGRAPGRWRS